MSQIYKNIEDNVNQVLISAADLSRKYNKLSINTISIANISTDTSVSVDLLFYRNINSDTESREFLGKYRNWNPLSTIITKYYIVKNLLIPYGTTVILEKDDLPINYESPLYDLYIKSDHEDGMLDVIINF